MNAAGAERLPSTGITPARRPRANSIAVCTCKTLPVVLMYACVVVVLGSLGGAYGSGTGTMPTSLVRPGTLTPARVPFRRRTTSRIVTELNWRHQLLT